MLKLAHSKLIMISGLIWLGVGLFLLPFGINLLVQGDLGPLVIYSSSIFGGLEEATVALIASALFIGYMKGRYVLGKSSKRIVARIRSLPDPAHIATAFSPAYLALIASMMALGVGIKYLGLSNDIRGVIDIAVGAAMINGSSLTLRAIYDTETP